MMRVAVVVVVVVVKVVVSEDSAVPLSPAPPPSPPDSEPLTVPETQHPDKMIVRRGWAIPQDAQDMTPTILRSACSCQSRCLVYPPCAAWAAVPLGEDSVNCTTTTAAPDTMTLESNAESLYGFKIGKLNSLTGVLEDADGTVYIKPDKQIQFQMAKDYCAKIPGFNLIMLKTERHFSLLPFFSRITSQGFINLQTTESGDLQWGDGSFMTEKEIEAYYEGNTVHRLNQIHQDKIKSLATENALRHFLCQGRTRGTW
ncbi:uncharacterized protein LOC135090093 [Scylla paramamosain]|uniref:uncharacterized protein LOC135090093 n=1 Tax=Scylla paramamosain TaxID=85552 RepID=UPI003083D6E9